MNDEWILLFVAVDSFIPLVMRMTFICWQILLQKQKAKKHKK